MQGASIVTSSTFVEMRKPIAPHRCVVIELHRHGRKNVWVRLERKPTSPADLVRGMGRTPSNDVVNITIVAIHARSLTFIVFSSVHWLRPAQLYSTQDNTNSKTSRSSMFSHLTLGYVRPFLGVVHELLTEYTVWSVSVLIWARVAPELTLPHTEKLLDVQFVFTRALPAGWSRQVGRGSCATRRLGIRRSHGGRSKGQEDLAHSRTTNGTRSHICSDPSRWELTSPITQVSNLLATLLEYGELTIEAKRIVASTFVGAPLLQTRHRPSDIWIITSYSLNAYPIP